MSDDKVDATIAGVLALMQRVSKVLGSCAITTATLLPNTSATLKYTQEAVDELLRESRHDR